LKAAAPQVGDEPIFEVHAGLDRQGAEEGLLAATQDPDLDAVPPAKRPEEPFAVRRVAYRGCRDCDHPGVSVAPRACEELMHRGHGPRNRVSAEHARTAAPEPGLNALFLEHLKPYARAQTRDKETDRVRTQLHEGD
jgi:hypothetical protein